MRGAIFGLSFWVLDAVIGHLLLYNASIGNLLILNASAPVIYHRLVTLGVIVGFSAFCARTETRLGQSESRFRTLVASMDDIVYSLDREQRFTGVYGRWLNLMHTTPGDFLGKTIQETLGGIQAMHEDANHRALDGERVIYEWSLDIENKTRYFQTSLSPLYDSNHTITGIVGVGRDITEQKRVAEALRRSEAKYRGIVEQSYDGIRLIDENGLILEWNKSNERITGLKREDVLGKPLWEIQYQIAPSELRSPEMRSHMERRIRETLATGKLPHFVPENRIQALDGTHRIVQSLFFPIKTEEGIMFGGIVRDITEQRQAEEALRESAELHRVVLSNISDAVFITDDQGRFTYICPNASIIFEYSLDEIRALGNISALLGLELFVPDDLAQTAEIPNIECDILDRRARPHTLLINVKRVSIQRGTILYTCRDITERKEVEQALQASQERFRRYFDLGLIGMAITAPDKGFIEVNQHFSEILGYSHDELIRKTWAELTYPQDLASSLLQFNRVMAGETDGITLEKRFIRQDGALVYTMVSAKCVRRPDGEVDYFVALVQDITERKFAEESRAQLAAIVESTDDAIIRKTLDGFITHWNSGALHMYGYTTSEVLGRHISMLVPSDRPDEVTEFAAALRAGKSIHNYETIRIKKNGQPFYVSLTISPIKDEAGKIVGVATIARDITARKRSEQALKTTNEQLKTIFDNLDNVFFSVDMVENRLLQLSPACRKVYGLPTEAVFSKPALWQDIIFPPDVITPDDPELAAGRLVTRVYQITDSNQTLRWIESRIKPTVDDTGQLLRVDGIISDITERRRAARLTAAGELATGTAHQINNPLTTVIAETHLLLQNLPRDSFAYESAQEIKDATYRAASIVQRLLNLARVQPSTMDRLDVNLSLQHAVELVRPQLRPHTAQILTDFDPELPLIFGSEDHLQDVWINILLNAKEAISKQDKGFIRVTTQTGVDDTIIVTIKDNGPGIPAHQRELVFDPFFTTKEHGAGLGLSICQDVITRHHGHISVQSDVDQGTRFIIVLPKGE